MCQETHGFDQRLADRLSRPGWGSSASLITTPVGRSYQLIQLGSASEAGAIEVRPQGFDGDRAIIVTPDRPYQGLIEGPCEIRPMYPKMIDTSIIGNWGHWLELELWGEAPTIVATRRAPLAYTWFSADFNQSSALTIPLVDHRQRVRTYVWAEGRKRQRLDIDVSNLDTGNSDTVSWTLLGIANNVGKGLKHRRPNRRDRNDRLVGPVHVSSRRTVRRLLSTDQFGRYRRVPTGRRRESRSVRRVTDGRFDPGARSLQLGDCRA